MVQAWNKKAWKISKAVHCREAEMNGKPSAVAEPGPDNAEAQRSIAETAIRNRNTF